MDIMERIKQGLCEVLCELHLDPSTPFIVEIPKDPSNGDYASNIAMQLTKVLKKNPRMIAEEIVQVFDKKKALVDKIEIAGPGFINFFVKSSSFSALIKKVLTLQDDYGKSDYGKGKKYDVEYVSANPTGDLHLGHARQAALGDSICNLLEAVGYDVTREYYVNDAGVQIDKLARSVLARYKEALNIACDFPEDGYHGIDLIAFANNLKEQYGDALLSKDIDYFKEISIQYELNKILDDLHMFRVRFDVFTHERSLYQEGWVDSIIPYLDQKGYIYEKDHAVWFKTTAFEDDKDRVLKKSDGTYTYVTPDIAYHKNKLERGFDYVVDILGADHHGYIKRMEAAIQAMGYKKEQLEIIIHQMVRLIKDGQEVKMSKRTGKAYTLKDLCEEIGVDAARYSFASKSASTHLDLDIDLAIKQSNENPVYYVQYAHARCCSILEGYQKLQLEDDTDGDLLNDIREVNLLKQLNEFEKVVLEAALAKAPYKITNYLYTLAQTFHAFYNECKVIDKDNLKLTAQRVTLAKMTKITIKNGLRLIGVEALNKM